MNNTFSAQWNQKYFYTGLPHFQLMKKLCEGDLAGDFEYLDFVCSAFVFGDAFTRSNPSRSTVRGPIDPERLTPEKMEEMVFDSTSRNPFNSFYRELILLCGERIILDTIDFLQYIGHLDSSIDRDTVIGPEERKVLARDNLLRICFDAMRMHLEKEYPAAVEREERYKAGEKCVMDVPLLRILTEYLAMSYVKKRGQPSGA